MKFLKIYHFFMNQSLVQISNRLENAYCSDGSYYAINSNSLASALVTTVDAT